MREFALTMTAAVAISLIASLTVTPMLAAALRPWHRARWANRQPPVPQLAPLLTHARYAQLDWALAHRGLVLLLLLGAVVLNVSDRLAPKGFCPRRIPAA
jgi:multidrug efflux pump